MALEKRRIALVGLTLLFGAVACQAPPQVPTAAPLPPTVAPAPTETPASGALPATETPVRALPDRLEVRIEGPEALAENPFDIRVDVTFTGPSGQEVTVPAFYDGDGDGGQEGDVWKARLLPDEPGDWSYRSSSALPTLNGQGGVVVAEPGGACPPYEPGGLPDFACTGDLRYLGERYLGFSRGGYWLKGGVDDPEDFLAPAQTAGFEDKFQALDYLAAQGVNSIYVMLNNVGGDGRNVWPWLGSTEAEAMANADRYDVAKLRQWDAIFSYAQARGIVLHLVLEDDSGWTGFDREKYYREMVARFSHYRGLYWNLAEEYNENYRPAEVLDYAALLRSLDPYDRPITVHHAGDTSRWEPFLGAEDIDLTSFQTDKAPQNQATVRWLSRLGEAGKVVPVSFDETGKLAPRDRRLARHIVWSVYLGGGNIELHLSPFEAYQPFEPLLADLRWARAFVEALPFCRMAPRNDLLLQGEGYVLARPGEVMAVYLPRGGPANLDLRGFEGRVRVSWYEPSSGEMAGGSSVTPGPEAALEPPWAGEAVLRLTGEAVEMERCQ